LNPNKRLSGGALWVIGDKQHYRNARTAKQAAEFWAIMPAKS